MTSYVYRPPTSWLGGGQLDRPRNNELIARGFYLTQNRSTLKPLRRKATAQQHYETEKQKEEKAKQEERIVLEGLKRFLNKKDDKGFEKFSQHRPMT